MAINPTVSRPVFSTNVKPPRRGARRVEYQQSFEDVINIIGESDDKERHHHSEKESQSGDVKLIKSGAIDERI
ncbi:MAG: hypothetical protein AAF541_18680 [Pseudomonadota bacterium]